MSISLGGLRSGSVSGTDITIEISSLAKSIKIRIPLTSVAGIYAKVRPGKCELGTDPRLLCDPSMQPDRRALYSLLQFGTLIPPLTPWRQLTRLIPGKLYRISGDDLSIVYRNERPIPYRKATTDISLPVYRQCEELAAELDQTIQRLCPDRRPIILFSGGVDSSLLAARAAAMGWKKTILINCQMGPSDPESVHAERMAHQLALSFERVPYSTDMLEDYLSRLGTMYPWPYGDLSAYPAFLLARAAIDRHPDYRVVLDGVGADGVFQLSAFGLMRNADFWRRVSRIPQFAGRSSGLLYEASKVWLRHRLSDSRIGNSLRILRLSAQMPLAHASVAQNALYDITYHVPDIVRDEVRQLLNELSQDCVPASGDLVRLFDILDVILICCGVFAQKDKPIFDQSSMEVRYPFLEPNMLRFGLTRAIHWPRGKWPKLPLMNLLAQHVPREMVFRPRRPFISHARELLQSEAFLRALDETLSQRSSISSLIDRTSMLSICRRLKRKQRLPEDTYGLIWTVVFTRLWLGQVRQQSWNS